MKLGVNIYVHSKRSSNTLFLDWNGQKLLQSMVQECDKYNTFNNETW